MANKNDLTPLKHSEHQLELLVLKKKIVHSVLIGNRYVNACDYIDYLMCCTFPYAF